jgi:hypothetical protein
MEPTKINLDSSPPSSPLSPVKKVINSTSKKKAAANMLIQIPNPKDVNYKPIKMNKFQTCRCTFQRVQTIRVLYHCSLSSSLIPYFWEIANNTNTYAQIS